MSARVNITVMKTPTVQIPKAISFVFAEMGTRATESFVMTSTNVLTVAFVNRTRTVLTRMAVTRVFAPLASKKLMANVLILTNAKSDFPNATIMQNVKTSQDLTVVLATLGSVDPDLSVKTLTNVN